MKIVKKIISKILITLFVITNIFSAYTGGAVAASHKTYPVVPGAREKSEIIVKYNDDSQADTVRTSISSKLKLKKLGLKKGRRKQA
jgi:hypothetical protein